MGRAVLLTAAVLLVALPAAVRGGSPPVPPSKQTCAAVTRRLDCGFAGITEELCQARGCCYDKKLEWRTQFHQALSLKEDDWAMLDDAEADAPSCFYGGDGVDIKTVHVIQSNHFDAGYADLSVNILNEYFDKYLPQAAKLGKQLRDRGGKERLRWMTQSYVISLYLDCPTGYGLHCPTEAELATFKEAVAEGDVTWHAFPHNAEPVLMSNYSLSFGIKLTHDLDDRFNLTRKTVLSQRDVPGMTRGLIPILVENGVKAISEGSNGRVFPVNVPPAFVWRDAASGHEIIGLWHAYDYGQLPGAKPSPARDTVVIPGLDQALVYAWRDDNAGPPESVAEVVGNYAQVEQMFPGAQVISSTLDNFTSIILQHKDKLPVIDQDLTDTWLMGAPSDPLKLASARALDRAATACLADGTCSMDDPAFYNFSRQAIKNGEHTWGLHVQSLGPFAEHGYRNAELRQELDTGNKYYNTLITSWLEQRDWGIHFPLQALDGHPFQKRAQAALDALKPALPKVASWTPVTGGTAVTLGQWAKVTVNAATGALSSLVVNGVDMAASNKPLGLLRYQTLTDDDFERELRDGYLRPGTGGENEYGKANCTAAQGCMSSLTTAQLKDAYLSPAKDALAVQVSFANATLVNDYGAPASAWLLFNASSNGTLSMTVTLVNKTLTRMPEAMYLTFDPRANTASKAGVWLQDKLGSVVDALDVAQGGARGLQAVSDYLHFNASKAPMSIRVYDSPVVRYGTSLYPFPQPLLTFPDLTAGASFVLFANPWTTNYPMWYGSDFRAFASDLQYRFDLTF